VSEVKPVSALRHLRELETAGFIQSTEENKRSPYNAWMLRWMPSQLAAGTGRSGRWTQHPD